MEGNLKKIVSETTRLCREAGQKVDPHVIAYLACQQASTAEGVALSGHIVPPLVAQLSQQLSKKLISPKDPDVATSKLQMLMELEFKKQRDAVEAEAAEVNERCEMLARSILNDRPTRETSTSAYEKSYNRILEYVCVKSSLDRAMGDQSSPEAQEVRAASESVFPLSALARFHTLGNEEKAMQIDELARLTLGVLLYNRLIGVGGIALPPSAQSALPAASRLLREMRSHAEDVQRQIIELHVALKATAEQDADAEAKMDALHSELIHRCQKLALLDSLEADLEAGRNAAQMLEGELEHTLAALQQSVGSAAAVSKEAVYPLFDNAGALHTALQGELRLLVVRQRLLDTLLALSAVPPSAAEVAASTASGSRKAIPPVLNTEGLYPELPANAAEQVEEMTLALQHGIEYVSAASVSADEISFGGFCPIMLATSPLLLVRGVPRLGLLKADGLILTFSSPKAVREFLEGPQVVLDNVQQAITRRPLLARLLGRMEALPQPIDFMSLITVFNAPLHVDFGCQTPVHFVEKHVDRNYEWNQWALRRRALALANLRQKATHSMQTMLTHFKRDGESQVWKPKPASNQTRVTKGQSMPKKLQYVAGLRGAPNVKMNVVRLDLDLGQPHQH